MAWDVDAAKVRAFVEQHVKIQDPSGGDGWIPFVLNRSQELASEFEVYSLKPGRWLVMLKPRQSGSTTWNLAVIAALLCLCPGIVVVFAAPDDVLRDAIPPKWQIIWQSVAASLSSWPGVARNNPRKFELENGSRVMWVRSGETAAKARKAALGDTVHFAVLSELAKWPHAQEALRVMLPALRRAKAPIVVDSTAPDGVGFGEEYVAIARAAYAGTNPHRELLFIPWWFEPSYRASVPASNYSDEEKALAAAHGLTPFQIQWRREEIATHGEAFQLIYPETVDAALSPRLAEYAFDERLINDLRRRELADYPEPLTSAQVAALLPEHLAARPSGDFLCRPRWGEPAGRGYVRIWRPPEPERRYFIGVDASEGKSFGDWQVAIVLDDAGNHCATIRTRLPVMQFAGLLQRTSELYNMATVEIEMMSTGPMVSWYLDEACPPEEIKLRRAHSILETPYRGEIRKRTATSISQVERKDAFVEYFETAPVQDPDLAREMLALDPETREKPRKSKSTSDDYLDGIGIAVCARRAAVYRPATSQTPARYGRRSARRGVKV